MEKFWIYNTLGRKIMLFKPIEEGKVRMYSCGPTVYDYTHLGHLRTYTNTDVLVRTLRWLGYEVFQVMNITDVGHLVTDADEGEDKVEKKARKEGLTTWEIAEKYTRFFFDSLAAVNVKPADKVVKATAHIKDMIKLVQRLEEKGYTYIIPGDGVYFDTSKLSDYGKLATVDLRKIKPGARVEMVPGKRHPTDFALWKFSPKDKKRQMEWDSPWGVGFPGWHIECSTMSMKYLGETFDIHTGGVDHINVHHTNEIAQSEAATCKPFAHYWVHFNYVLVEGEKMSKSKGNFYTIEDIKKRGIDLLALRYLFLTSHYQQLLNFSWRGLKAAESAYHHLVSQVARWKSRVKGKKLVVDKTTKFFQDFKKTVSYNLRMPEALAVVWRLVDSPLAEEEKLALLLDWDKILGLELENKAEAQLNIPPEIRKLAEKRQHLREEKKYTQADKLREEIEAAGYRLEDTKNGYYLSRKEGLDVEKKSG